MSKYKKGDKVLIKTLPEIKAIGYSCRQGPSGLFIELPGGYDFVSAMETYCGHIVTIAEVMPAEQGYSAYTLGEDVPYIFTEPMIRGIVLD